MNGDDDDRKLNFVLKAFIKVFSPGTIGDVIHGMANKIEKEIVSLL